MRSMLSSAEERSLRDILFHIDLATEFVAGFDRDTFKSDLRTLYAVTRCLEIISEASRRLPDDLKARPPGHHVEADGRRRECLSSRLRGCSRAVRVGYRAA